MKLANVIDIPRLFRALVNSGKGLRIAFFTEAAFRFEVLLTIIVIPAAICLAQNTIQLCLLIGSWLLVMMIELLNTAIEATIDRIGKDWHELSGIAKDMGSAAVLIALINAGFIWAVIVYQRFF